MQQLSSSFRSGILSRCKSMAQNDHTNLSRADIEALVHALKRNPPFSGADAQARTQERTAALPQRLRSKVPLISDLCAEHAQITSRPLASLLHAFWQTTAAELNSTWRPLRSQGSLDPGQLEIVLTAESVLEEFYASDCSGCHLSHLIGDHNRLLALGSVVIARLKSSDWKRSNRIIFVETSIRATATGELAERMVQNMWQSGADMHLLRGKFHRTDRSYIDAYVAQVKNQPVRAPPPRPQRRPSQDHHVRFVSNETFSGDPASQLAARQSHHICTSEDTEGPSDDRSHQKNQIRRKPVANGSMNVDMSTLFGSAPKPAAKRDAPCSKNQQDCPHWSEGAEEIEPLIGVRDTSRSPDSNRVSETQQVEAGLDSATEAPEPSTDRAPPLSKDPELATYPRDRMPNITNPAGNFGRGHTVVQTRAPRLRLGRNGEVKGPYDSVSDLLASCTVGISDRETTYWI